MSLPARTLRVLRAGGSALIRWVRSRAPDQWILLGFLLLVAVYLLVLLLQPSAVGRGGR